MKKCEKKISAAEVHRVVAIAVCAFRVQLLMVILLQFYQKFQETQLLSTLSNVSVALVRT